MKNPLPLALVYVLGAYFCADPIRCQDSLHILIKMIPSQQNYFTDSILVPCNLVDAELVLPLSRHIPKAHLKEAQKEYFLLRLSTFYNMLYYLPRKYETRIMVYRKSKVKETSENWPHCSPRKKIQRYGHRPDGQSSPDRG